MPTGRPAPYRREKAGLTIAGTVVNVANSAPRQDQPARQNRSTRGYCDHPMSSVAEPWAWGVFYCLFPRYTRASTCFSHTPVQSVNA